MSHQPLPVHIRQTTVRPIPSHRTLPSFPRAVSSGRSTYAHSPQPGTHHPTPPICLPPSLHPPCIIGWMISLNRHIRQTSLPTQRSLKRASPTPTTTISLRHTAIVGAATLHLAEVEVNSNHLAAKLLLLLLLLLLIASRGATTTISGFAEISYALHLATRAGTSPTVMLSTPTGSSLSAHS